MDIKPGSNNQGLEMVPQHIAIIMDGNRRWAKARHLPIVAGHKKVVTERVEELIEHAAELGIPYITFWAFSTENWGRPSDEVKGIMMLFRLALEKYAAKLITKGARVKVIGDLSKFDPDIRQGMEAMMEKSKNNTKITVTFALNYGGRDEIVRAVNKSMRRRGDEAMSELDLSEYLDTVGMPDPDLIVRTGGEQRLSGFMLWQCQYSEFYFPETLMPDFGGAELDVALEEYSRRERRRGK